MMPLPMRRVRHLMTAYIQTQIQPESPGDTASLLVIPSGLDCGHRKHISHDIRVPTGL